MFLTQQEEEPAPAPQTTSQLTERERDAAYDGSLLLIVRKDIESDQRNGESGNDGRECQSEEVGEQKGP